MSSLIFSVLTSWLNQIGFPYKVEVGLTFFIFFSVEFKISMRLRLTSMLQDLTVRPLHLFISHMLGLNIHKVCR